jgi:hypothetical protein
LFSHKFVPVTFCVCLAFLFFSKLLTNLCLSIICWLGLIFELEIFWDLDTVKFFGISRILWILYGWKGKSWGFNFVWNSWCIDKEWIEKCGDGKFFAFFQFFLVKSLGIYYVLYAKIKEHKTNFILICNNFVFSLHFRETTISQPITFCVCIHKKRKILL